jgi:hypothetical protein
MDTALALFGIPMPLTLLDHFVKATGYPDSVHIGHDLISIAAFRAWSVSH